MKQSACILFYWACLGFLTLVMIARGKYFFRRIYFWWLKCADGGEPQKQHQVLQQMCIQTEIRMHYYSKTKTTGIFILILPKWHLYLFTLTILVMFSLHITKISANGRYFPVCISSGTEWTKNRHTGCFLSKKVKMLNLG